MAKTKVDELRESLEKRRAAETTSGDTGVEEILAEAEQQADSAAPVVGESAEERVQAAEAQAQEHRDAMLRTMAEFENFRKRTEREKADAIAFANEKLLTDLMPILDHMDAALTSVADGEGGALAEGVQLTFREFLATLSKFGFTEVPAEVGAAFDPSIHEAVSQVPSEEQASNTIVARHRRGYSLNGRVLRAALVVVAK